MTTEFSPVKLKAEEPALRRCPACGQPIDDAGATRCTLCNWDFGKRRSGGTDSTPYAQAYSEGRAGWRKMSEWIWFAGSERLKHLALMQSSAASRRFALRNVFALSLALAVFRAIDVGWRWVSNSPALESTGSVLPRGYYWMHLAGSPRPLPSDHAHETAVDLWWNPIHATLGLVSGFAATWVLMLLLSLFVRTGLNVAFGENLRGERRLSAAVHYSTAWLMLFVVAALVASLRPVGYIGEISRWSWYPSSEVFTLSAAVLAGLGAVAWWFWLVRLSAMAPAKARGKVTLLFSVGAPTAFSALVAAAFFGLRYGLDGLFRALRVAF